MLVITVKVTGIIPGQGKCRMHLASGWWVCWCLLHSPCEDFVSPQSACLKRQKNKAINPNRKDSNLGGKRNTSISYRFFLRLKPTRVSYSSQMSVFALCTYLSASFTQLIFNSSGKRLPHCHRVTASDWTQVVVTLAHFIMTVARLTPLFESA